MTLNAFARGFPSRVNTRPISRDSAATMTRTDSAGDAKTSTTTAQHKCARWPRRSLSHQAPKFKPRPPSIPIFCPTEVTARQARSTADDNLATTRQKSFCQKFCKNLAPEKIRKKPLPKKSQNFGFFPRGIFAKKSAKFWQPTSAGLGLLIINNK